MIITSRFVHAVCSLIIRITRERVKKITFQYTRRRYKQDKCAHETLDHKINKQLVKIFIKRYSDKLIRIFYQTLYILPSIHSAHQGVQTVLCKCECNVSHRGCIRKQFISYDMSTEQQLKYDKLSSVKFLQLFMRLFHVD